MSSNSGQLQDEVPGVPNETATGLEQPLLEARQGPTLDGEGQDQPAQQIAEVIGDRPEEQPDLVGSEPVTGEPGPVGGFLALLGSRDLIVRLPIAVRQVVKILLKGSRRKIACF
jgi:hypothetical protein